MVVTHLPSTKLTDYVVVAGADIRYVDSVLPIIPTLLPLRCASACAFTTTIRALIAALWLYLSCADRSPDMTNP